MKRIVCVVALLQLALAALAQSPDLYSNLKWRELGPLRGGRSVACAGSASRPKEFYMGATGGGIWKSEDAGKEWKCVSDGFLGTASVGALAVDPKNPDIVYAGTGEKDIRGNISHGDGIYKSTDAGATWTNIGLKDTQTISRIVVDPANPNTIYVAALGHIYGPNKERGLYKSTDGGKTWQNILFESEKAGAIDVEIDPYDPQTIYCATWEAWRTGYMLNSGGPGSKLWRSTNGGKTWSDLSKAKGMPDGPLGKIDISPSPAKQGVVYAIVEAHDGGVFRSDDGGSTWMLANNSREWRQRAWYYTHIFAHPKDVDTCWVLNVSIGYSTDGGKTLRTVFAGHSDNHDLWINPANPEIRIVSNDGGATVTSDDGKSWTEQDMPTAQIYHITADNAYPYHVLGAQQDNSSIRMLSTARPVAATPGRGGQPDWTGTAGGESGYVVAKPNNPDVVYGGNYGGDLDMIDHRLNRRRAINPWPDMAMGRAAIDLDERFQWTFPIVFSPHNPDMMYVSSQHIFRTTNGGQSWQRISPDLSKNDPKTLQSSGGPITKDNTSIEYYGTVFTLAESPKKAGIIWAGTDDGLVHVTQNGGKSWEKVTPRGMPEWGLCSMIEPSPHDKEAAYLAVDNHENDDYGPYVYRTTDFGKSWTKIVSGIPSDTFVRVVREDPGCKGLLYAGTERGVYVSFDSGEHWQTLQLNLPLTPVHDIVLKNGDLCIATHGRGFWILDDVTPLRQMAAVAPNTPFLFKPRDPFRPGQATISYYLPSPAKEVKVEIKDAAGEVVAQSSSLDTDKGLRRFSTSLRYPGYRGFPGMIFWGGGGGSITAPAGNYTVNLDVDGKVLTQTLHYTVSPISESTEADSVAQVRMARLVASKVQDANNGVAVIRDAKKAIDEVVAANKDLTVDGEALKAKLSAIEEELYQVKNRSGQDPLNYPVKLNNRLAGLLGELSSMDYPPSEQVVKVFEKLNALLKIQLDALDKVRTVDFAAFNAKLKAKGLKELSWPKPTLEEPRSGRRGGDEGDEGTDGGDG